MSALVKELLIDFTHNRLDIDTRVTLAYSIEQLYKAGTFSKTDILFLEYYLQGFRPEEIAIKFFVSTELVLTTLTRLCIAIEFESGFLDEFFIRSIAEKYNPRQIIKARTYLEQHGKDFMYETI